MIDLDAIQAALREQGIDAWLFYDHHHRDPIAYRLLELPPDLLVTRRWYYLIPAQGEPRKLAHRVEAHHLDALPGVSQLYSSWRELEPALRSLCAGVARVAMQYSPENAIPAISLVDAGTVEMLRRLGVDVVSSANLVARFESIWTPEGLASHREAGLVVQSTIDMAWRRIREAIDQGQRLTEHDLQQQMIANMRAGGLLVDEPPIVAIGPHAGDPHFEPRADNALAFADHQLVLLDVWAKCARPGAIYYDVTWVGYSGWSVPEAMQKVFSAVRDARDAAVEFVRTGIAAGVPLHGFEVDRVARGVIERAGWGAQFVHRTGHSLGQQVHANGANIDDLETRDDRRLLPQTGFTIEPGIYLPEFGVRLEVDLHLSDTAAEVTTPLQREFVRI